MGASDRADGVQRRAKSDFAPWVSLPLRRPTCSGPWPGKGRRVGLRGVGVVVVVLVAVVAGVQWFRPIPSPVFALPCRLRYVSPDRYRCCRSRAPGSAPCRWRVPGASGGWEAPYRSPIAGLARVMTAYVVLRDHPLAPGAVGLVYRGDGSDDRRRSVGGSHRAIGLSPWPLARL